uniref:Uncharacterized protein n=1 Tax=Timema monikensis TaxID=170555 RepID=A0A7R9EL90_9NEOP|nr:unnamed protein product [Timema monikensis]
MLADYTIEVDLVGPQRRGKEKGEDYKQCYFGGGPPPDENLTEIQKRIVGLLGQVAIEGIESALEVGFTMATVVRREKGEGLE